MYSGYTPITNPTTLLKIVIEKKNQEKQIA